VSRTASGILTLIGSGTGPCRYEPAIIALTGGGPAGLSFARSLAHTPLRIAVLERQSEEQLAEPAYDGREIALTQRSIRLLRDYGAWARMPNEEISPLRAADVINGASSRLLTFDTGRRLQGELGMLVSNQLIRRALFECVREQANVELLTGEAAAAVEARGSAAEVTLASGKVIRAKLLVAADSRFSAVRDQLGIGAEMKRTGTAMVVCRVAHELDHGHVAVEWFRHSGTIAMLPLNGRMSSAVLTLPIPEAEQLGALDDDALGAELTARFERRLGAMRVASTRHIYPLVMTFSRRFTVPGAALIGDAAVGMHPVTAHGFNLGLASVDRLASGIRGAIRRRDDWSSERVLRRYELGHRRTAWPIYAGTNFIVGLYGNRGAPAMAARHVGLRLARRMPLFRSAVRSMLVRT